VRRRRSGARTALRCDNNATAPRRRNGATSAQRRHDGATAPRRRSGAATAQWRHDGAATAQRDDNGATTAQLLDCDVRRRLHWRFAVERWSVTLMVPHMVHLQDVVKLHTFVLGHLGALLLACSGFDLRFALVAFDLVSDSICCEGVGVGVGARGGSTCVGGYYLRGALGWERRANLRTTKKARSHLHTQAQATQSLHGGPPTPISTAFQHGNQVSVHQRGGKRRAPAEKLSKARRTK